MEKALTKLFDFQKFAGNSKLQEVIDSVHRRPQEISLDDADLIAAAGSPYCKPAKPEDDWQTPRQ